MGDRQQYSMDEVRRAFFSFGIMAGRQPRPGQLEAIQYAANSPSPVTLIHAPAGSGKCCRYDTLVSTTTGLRRVIDVNLGDEVYGYDEKVGTVVAKRVTGKYVEDDVEAVTIRTARGFEFTGTPDHRLLVCDGERTYWKELREFAEGEYVPVSSRVMESLPSSPIPLEDNLAYDIVAGRYAAKRVDIDAHNPDVLYFLGRYISDGNVNLNAICLTSQAENDRAFMHRFAKDHDLHLYVRKDPRSRAVTYTLSSADFVDKLHQIGVGGKAATKRIPDYVFTLPPSLRKSFLAGMFDGDSHFGKSNVTYTTISCDMATQLQALLLSIGIVSTLIEKNRKYQERRYVSYDVCIVNGFIDRLDLPLKNVGKMEALAAIKGKKRNTNLHIFPYSKEYCKANGIRPDCSRTASNPAKVFQSYCYGSRHPHVDRFLDFAVDDSVARFVRGIDAFFDKVVSVTQTRTTVCDICVEGIHNYIAAGFVSHNSSIGLIIGRLTGGCNYLVNSKALQYQITDEFPEARSLFGRANYPCIESMETMTVDQCPFREPWDECESYAHCTYRVEKELTARHKLRILNYAYFMSECNFVKQSAFSGSPIIICDEADTLDQVLMSFIRIEVTANMIKKYGMPRPRYKTAQAKDGVASWIDWANRSEKLVKIVLDGLPDTADRKEVEQHQGLLAKLKMFQNIVDDTWIYDEQDTRYGKRWVFSPTWIKPELTEQFLRRHGAKFILMSATFKPLAVTALELGIPQEEIDYFEVDNSYSTDNKPIYMNPVATFSSKTIDEEWPKARAELKAIFARHAHQKGLIHTSSYKLAQLVMAIGDPRLMTHTSKDREDTLKAFKESDEPRILVSPSMERGVNLPDDAVRWVVILKAPFPSLGDKQVATRLYSSRKGQYWYRATAAQTIEQQVGRGVRHEEDWCHIYLLDNHIRKLIVEDPTMFSKHFKACIRWGDPEWIDRPSPSPNTIIPEGAE